MRVIDWEKSVPKRRQLSEEKSQRDYFQIDENEETPDNILKLSVGNEEDE
jgi:hypothetical protein